MESDSCPAWTTRGPTTRQGHTDLMDELGGCLGGLLGGSYVARVWQRRARRQKLEGVIECAFRDRSGSTSRLMRRWRQGRATLAPGRITVVPFVALGFRMRRPRTTPIQITVLAVSAASRQARGRERWWVSGTVFEIDTPIGKVEWALSPFTDIAWAIHLVSPPSSTDTGS